VHERIDSAPVFHAAAGMLCMQIRRRIGVALKPRIMVIYLRLPL
jgi:hypothetical protein